MDVKEVAHHAHEHGGWIERTITELAAEVEALKKENAELRARTQTELAALSREWRDVLIETGVGVLVAAVGDAPPTENDIHPYFAGKMDLLRHLRSLADADIERFTLKEEDHGKRPRA